MCSQWYSMELNEIWLRNQWTKIQHIAVVVPFRRCWGLNPDIIYVFIHHTLCFLNWDLLLCWRWQSLCLNVTMWAIACYLPAGRRCQTHLLLLPVNVISCCQIGRWQGNEGCSLCTQFNNGSFNLLPLAGYEVKAWNSRARVMGVKVKL